MPLGGKNQITPAQAMAAKIPVLGRETKTCSVMAYGFDPFLSQQSPYRGAYQAVVESVCKLTATGASHKNCHLTFQEYFERLGTAPERWGKPMAALLGALEAQKQLKAGAIGGKDSMSGSFDDIDVPPTLVSFAIAAANTDNLISPEFKQAGSRVVLVQAQAEGALFQEESLLHTLDTVEQLIAQKKVRSAYVPGAGGIGAAIAVMCFGNGLGFAYDRAENLFDTVRGAFLAGTDGRRSSGRRVGRPHDGRTGHCIPWRRNTAFGRASGGIRSHAGTHLPLQDREPGSSACVFLPNYPAGSSGRPGGEAPCFDPGVPRHQLRI